MDLFMYDEDTGEKLKCPYCGSGSDDCPHIAAIIEDDHHFIGGYVGNHYQRLSQPLNEAFNKLIDNNNLDQLRNIDWDEWDPDGDFSVTWNNILIDIESNYQHTHEMCWEQFGTSKIIYRILYLICPGFRTAVFDGGIPGMSSSYKLLYTDEAKEESEEEIRDLTEFVLSKV